MKTIIKNIAKIFKKDPVIVEHDSNLRAGHDSPVNSYKTVGFTKLL